MKILLMKRVLGPLTRMTDITRNIASGDYSDKVPIASGDEVGELATAFNRMAESLQKIEQLRKTMMIDVAHELRTPLTNIKGYLEALTDGVVTPSSETFALLQEETLRLVHLVEGILRLAKADAAKATLHITEVRLFGLIGHIMDSLQAQFDEKKIRVETHLSNGVDQVRADPDKLSQVITNLLQNALQYTLPGGTVGISVERMPGEIKVIFSNTGGEIAEKDLPYIFERFYRGEKSRSREHGGAGIGLAIVKELVEAHGGKVGAEVSSGKVRLWFTLPANSFEPPH